MTRSGSNFRLLYYPPTNRVVIYDMRRNMYIKDLGNLHPLVFSDIKPIGHGVRCWELSMGVRITNIPDHRRDEWYI